MLSRHIKQEVCPWNNPRLVPLAAEADYWPRPPVEVEARSSSALRASLSRGPSRSRVAGDAGPGDLPGMESPSLVKLMRMTREEWDIWTRGSAIRRAGYAGFRRNLAVAMGNWLASVAEAPEEAVGVLQEALEDEDPL